MTNEEREQVIAQLESIAEHCSSMMDADDPADIWAQDVWALNLAVGEMRAGGHLVCHLEIPKDLIDQAVAEAADKIRADWTSGVLIDPCEGCERFKEDAGGE